MATSNARNVQLESNQPSALDEHPGVKAYFDQAQAGDAALDQEQAQGRGSQMVEQDQPSPELKPDPDLAAEIDRQDFNERWESEQSSAREAYLERYEQQRDQGQSGQERGNDWENSL